MATRRTSGKTKTAVKPTTARTTPAVKASAAKTPAAKTAAAKTKAVKTAAAKTAAVKTPAAKTPVPNPQNPDPTGAAVKVSTILRKKRLLDLVTERAGVKRKFAKPAMEATLAVLAEAIAAGEELNLPPLGKVKVQRETDKANAKVFVARIRQPKNRPPAPKDPLAEAAE